MITKLFQLVLNQICLFFDIVEVEISPLRSTSCVHCPAGNESLGLHHGLFQ